MVETYSDRSPDEQMILRERKPTERETDTQGFDKPTGMVLRRSCPEGACQQAWCSEGAAPKGREVSEIGQTTPDRPHRTKKVTIKYRTDVGAGVGADVGAGVGASVGAGVG